MKTNNTKKNKKLAPIIGVVGGIFLLIFLWYLVSALFFYFPIGEKVASGITKEKIMSLKIGMNRSDVIDILGAPISTENSSSGVFLIYATPGLLGAGIEINLKINGNRLSGIYIEESDLGIYLCDRNKCPGIIQPEKFDKLISSQ